MESKYLTIEVEFVYKNGSPRKRKKPASSPKRKPARIPDDSQKPAYVSEPTLPARPDYAPGINPAHIPERESVYIPGNGTPKKQLHFLKREPVYIPGNGSSIKSVQVSGNGSLLKLTKDVLNSLYMLVPGLNLKRKGEVDNFIQMLAWRGRPEALTSRERRLLSGLDEDGIGDFFDGVGRYPHQDQPQLSMVYGKSEKHLRHVFSSARESVFSPGNRRELGKYLKSLEKGFQELLGLRKPAMEYSNGPERMRLLEIYSTTRDPIIESLFVEAYMGYVKTLLSCAIHKLPNKKYGFLSDLPRSGLSGEDLESCGWMGFLEQLRRYDPAMAAKAKKLNGKFVSSRVRGAMVDEMRKMSFIPRLEIQRSAAKFRALEEELAGLDTEAAAHELAHRTDRNGREVGRYMFLAPDTVVRSLNELIYDGYKTLELGNSIPDMEAHRGEGVGQDLEDADIVERMLRNLPAKEKRIMKLYYIAELTMREIGDVIGLSESRICQLHSRAITHLTTLARNIDQEV